MGIVLVVLLDLVIGILYLGIWFLVDLLITNKRVEENQKAWNEYSKNMTDDEKFECFIDFLRKRQLEKGWSHLYIPRM